MSLLGTPVYANPSTPLWVSVGGDTIDGNLVVDGTLSVSGQSEMTNLDINSGSVYPTQGKLTLSASFLGTPSTGMQIYSDGGVNGQIMTNGSLLLGRKDANQANTTFTPSAYPTNGDVLAVGGRITTAAGGGITPISSPTPLVNVTIGGGAVTMVPTTPIPIVTGKWYDIQVTGYWTIPLLSAPAAGDKAEILVAVGAGSSPAFFKVSAVDEQYPGFVDDPWVAGTYRPFKIRARLLAGASLATPIITATLTGTGVYPAGLDAEIDAVSIVALS